jgi:hypothetical protein
MADNEGVTAETAIGLLIWGAILYFILRLILKKMKGNTANATATASAEGGESSSGARADVGGIHIHLHIGDGQSLSLGGAGDDDDHYLVNPAELLRPGTVNGDGIGSMRVGGNVQEVPGGSSLGALPVAPSHRRRTRNSAMEVAE